LKLCKNCSRQHFGKPCTVRNCFKCNKTHNSLLHLTYTPNSNKIENNQKKNEKGCTELTTSISAHVFSHQTREQVLLATAIVNIRNDRDSGDSQCCRILLDSGSQCNLITENMVQSLRLKKKRIHHSVMGIGNIPQAITSSVIVSVRSRYNQFKLSILCLSTTFVAGQRFGDDTTAAIDEICV